jgi:hypothetical protein
LTTYSPDEMLDIATWLERQADKSKKAAPNAAAKCAKAARMIRQAAGDTDEIKDKAVEAANLAAVVTLWNEIALPPLPRVSRMGQGLRRKLVSRWKTFPDLEEYRRLFLFIMSDPFYRGGGPRQWTVDLKWLVDSDDRMQNLLDKAEARRVPKASLPTDWREECHRLHNSRCTNVHFHKAMMDEAPNAVAG